MRWIPTPLRNATRFAPVLAVALIAPTATLSGQSSEAEVRSVVERFVAAWKAGDGDALAELVADSGAVIWPSGSGADTSVSTMSFEDIRAHRRAKEIYELERIYSIDVVDGQLAVAKVEIRWSAGTYIDYYTLFRLGGRWKIVTKTWVTRRSDGDEKSRDSNSGGTDVYPVRVRIPTTGHRERAPLRRRTPVSTNSLVRDEWDPLPHPTSPSGRGRFLISPRDVAPPSERPLE